MFFTLGEFIDLVVMVFAIGYIFSYYFKREPADGYDPLTYYAKNTFIEDLKHGIIVAAPAIVLHELMHKFVAMAFGATAVLHAPSLMGIPYGWYILVIIMQALKFPLFFFVGGYVTHSAMAPIPSALVSLAGPFTNLILYLLCLGLIKYKLVNRKYYNILTMAGKLNMFLFVFNLIPLPGFDGYNAVMSLIRLL
jgi:Zn-dependent protease